MVLSLGWKAREAGMDTMPGWPAEAAVSGGGEGMEPFGGLLYGAGRTRGTKGVATGGTLLLGSTVCFAVTEGVAPPPKLHTTM